MEIHTDACTYVYITFSIKSICLKGTSSMNKISKVLIFLLIHTCGLCLLHCGEPLPSTKFPFNHFSEEMFKPSSCGIKCWNLTGRYAWDQRGVFWGFCGNKARLCKGIFRERSFADAQEGFLDIQGLTSLHVLHPPKGSLWDSCAEPTLLWREKAGLWTSGKVGCLKD